MCPMLPAAYPTMRSEEEKLLVGFTTTLASTLRLTGSITVNVKVAVASLPWGSTALNEMGYSPSVSMSRLELTISGSNSSPVKPSVAVTPSIALDPLERYAASTSAVSMLSEAMEIVGATSGATVAATEILSASSSRYRKE